jgi:hypothetical protein
VRSAVHEARKRTRKQEHLALLDLNITKDAIVYDTKEHITLVLIEPFLPHNEEVTVTLMNESFGRLSTVPQFR